METSTNTTTKNATSITKKPQKRSQIACIRCNRRRARCNASTIGLPCSACADLGLADCQFIQSKRKWKKGMRQPKSSNLTENVEFLREDRPPPSASPQSEGLLPQDESDKEDTEGSVFDSITIPSESNESETWTKAADVVSVGNIAGDVSVSYLGGTWVLPATQVILDMNSVGVYRAISVPLTPGFCRELISSFFDKFHTIFPILDRRDFEESLRGKTLSRLLLDTVLLAGVTHCSTEVLRAHGFATRTEAIQYFYERVSSGFDASRNTETLVLIQCMFVMQFYWMSPRDWKDMKFWLSTAIRQAQFLGLHKKTEIHKLEPPKQSLCRRIWWCLYIRDRQCASATGIPVMIQDEDCDVEFPSLDDMDESMSWQTKLSFLQLSKLMRKVRSLLRAEFGLKSTQPDPGCKGDARRNIISEYESWQAEIPTELKNPSKESGIAVFYLHISFYTQILLLNQSIARNHYSSLPIIDIHSLVSNQAAHMITVLINQLSVIWGMESLLFNCCYSIFAAMTVQLVMKKGAPELSRHNDFCMNMKCLQQLGDSYPIALWIEKLINRVLDEAKDRGDSFAANYSVDIAQRQDMLPRSGRPNFPMRSPHNQFQQSQSNNSTLSTVTQFASHRPTGSEADFGSDMPNPAPKTPANRGFNASSITTMEQLEDYLTATSTNPLSHVQDDLDGWQAAYNQLELDKLF